MYFASNLILSVLGITAFDNAVLAAPVNGTDQGAWGGDKRSGAGTLTFNAGFDSTPNSGVGANPVQGSPAGGNVNQISVPSINSTHPSRSGSGPSFVRRVDVSC